LVPFFAATDKLWVRRKKTGLKLLCSGCGQHVATDRIHEVCEREVRGLPCFEYTTTVVVETYRVRCPGCGIRAEKVAQLPSKAPYSKRFEVPVGQACESGAARQVARRMGLAASTVRAIDLRYLERWEAKRRQPPLRQMGVDEVYRGKKGKLQPNRRVFKAYLLKESLERLWNYRYEGAMLNYLKKWMDQLKWQRLVPFEKLADTLLKHLHPFCPRRFSRPARCFPPW
jgi:transposase